MTVGSLFAGIGGFDLGLERAGMEIRWQCEIDAFCARVLEKHWPHVGRYGDIRELRGDELERVDLVCGGFPCQDLSVAGKRAGLAGERSGLFFEFVRLVVALAPRWVLIENVPGLLSSNGGRDMGTVLGALAELGYGYAYRVLDAEYFGVAQRRRRVFIVGCLGDGTASAKVLFEPESCERDTPPGRKTEEDVAATITPGIDGNRKGWSPINEADNLLVARSLTSSTGGVSGKEQQATYLVEDTSLCLKARGSMRCDPTQETYVYQCHGGNVGPMGMLRRGTGGLTGGIPFVAHPLRAEHDASEDGFGRQTLIPIAQDAAVRRLTPTECERLQGFPDGWTSLDGRAADSPRYRALGNAVCVPVAEWIGKRIMGVEHEICSAKGDRTSRSS